MESNERLEFLGDAVVDLAIADLIVTRYPDSMRDRVHSCAAESSMRRTRAIAARELDLGAVMRVGRGVKKERGAERPSLLADAFEAVVAAIYFERGYVAAKDFVHGALAREVAKRPSPRVTSIPRPSSPVGRSRATRHSALRGGRRRTRALDHLRGDRARGRPGGRGEGRSKKSAEGQAARSAWREHDDA